MSDEEIQKEDDLILEPELDEADVPSIIYYLIESFKSLDEIDTAIMSKGQQRKIESWKEKLWNSLDSYIKILPSE